MEADLVFTGPTVTLEQVLHSRTRRATRQQALLQEGAPCLVSFTLNIPGGIKQFPLARAAFQEGLERLHYAFGKSVWKEETIDEPTGSEALLAVDADPVEIKRKTVAIEDDHPLGRLFDMDVLGPDGRSLSRTELGAPQRTCLLCGNSAKVCGRSRAHALPELRQAIALRLEEYFKNKYADACMTAAWRAMLSEVSATPKPGLVDRNNSGSHRDMDFFTFVDSAAALAPHFRQMYLMGWDHALDDPAALFTRLRVLGQQAEADMFAATHGVNTHKGLIFSMGLLSGAFGAKQRQGSATLDSVLALCADMGRCALGDFATSPDTNGKRCYQTYRLPGIRGEAAAGFPSAAAIGLPTLRRWTGADLSLNDASLYALLALLAQVSDTNMIRRGGLATAEACRQQAQALLDRITPESLHQELLSLDQAYIAANLSPGGCADLLALSLMLFFLYLNERPSAAL